MQRCSIKQLQLHKAHRNNDRCHCVLVENHRTDIYRLHDRKIDISPVYRSIYTSIPLAHDESAAFETLHVASVEIIDCFSRVFVPNQMNVFLKINNSNCYLRSRFSVRLGNQSVFDHLIGETNRTKVKC